MVLNSLRFFKPDGTTASAVEWLNVWVRRYPADRYPEAVYADLIKRSAALKPIDFEKIGAWKDAALTVDGQFNRKWKPTMPRVAYDVWKIAASELVGVDTKSLTQSKADLRTFLMVWENRAYAEKYGRQRVIRFGLSRATTLLHFLTGGQYPIFDSNVQRAVGKLTGYKVEKTVDWYLDKYCPIFDQLRFLCSTPDARILDKALFSYGRKQMTNRKRGRGSELRRRLYV